MRSAVKFSAKEDKNLRYAIIFIVNCSVVLQSSAHTLTTNKEGCTYGVCS